MKVQKEDKVVEVTEKAYTVVYAPLGYVPVKEGGKRGSRRSKETPADQDKSS